VENRIQRGGPQLEALGESPDPAGAPDAAGEARIAQLQTELAELDQEREQPLPAELARVPDAIRVTLRLRAAVVQVLARLHLKRVVHFVGGGPAHATALEGALKLREASYLSAEGHEVESILHGPLISLTAEDSVVMLAQPGAALARTAELAAALREIGVATLAVGPAAASLTATLALETPTVHERLAPIINVVPFQWLALEVSRQLGVDADSFRKAGRYAAAQSKFIL